MTDIAEYFRDLAADDRFFGAEPPTPDMAMLRTIAETRAKHAVTAQSEDNGVTLRPSSVPAAAAMTAAFDANAATGEPSTALAVGMAGNAADAGRVDTSDIESPVPDSEGETPTMEAEAEVAPAEDDVASETVAHVASEAAADVASEAATDEIGPDEYEEDESASFFTDAAEEAAEEQSPEDSEDTTESIVEDDSVAAKLARIRGVVEADRQSDSTYAEDEHADDMMTTEPEMAEDTLAAAFAADALDDAPFAEVEGEAPIAEVENETPIFDEEDNTSDAIGSSDIWESDSDSEDAMADDLAGIFPAELDATGGDTVAAEATEDTVTTAPAEQEEPATGEAEITSEETADEDLSTEEDTADETLSPRQERRIRIRRVRQVQAEAEAAALAAAHAESRDDATDGMAIIDEYDDETGGGSDDDDLTIELASIEAGLTGEPTAGRTEDASEDDDLLAELAAIRADEVSAKTAQDTGDVDQDEEEDDFISSFLGYDADDAKFEAELASYVSVEDSTDVVEAGVMTEDDHSEEAVDETEETVVNAEAADDEPMEDELVDVKTAEQDATDEMPADDGENAREDEDDHTKDNHTVVPSAPDMERLFAATDSRLSGEDTSRRHANISHLKAAVAARRADGPVEEKAETETDVYRADLASTVRPRRNAPSVEARTPRPERPAPLVLVSEQRVTETPAADVAPVQPRRAPRTAEVEERDEALAGAEDFEAFATDVGASDLSDILEAAAVYSTKIMGQDSFSRPRLLHLAAEAVEDMSREDGLRGFGQLLRDGTIRKVSRGVFALAADSRYTEEAERRVG
ncbi:hypothetical protein [Jannaschia faecimaris]|nr:hypothetical protein [Jannaschia faecimaris]